MVEQPAIVLVQELSWVMLDGFAEAQHGKCTARNGCCKGWWEMSMKSTNQANMSKNDKNFDISDECVDAMETGHPIGAKQGERDRSVRIFRR